MNSPIEKHSIANYPKSFHGLVVRKENFCIQFTDVKTTLRVNLKNPREGLIKTLKAEMALPVTTAGAEVYISGMRTPIDQIEQLQEALIEAYRKYYDENNIYYEQTYNKRWVNFLRRQRVAFDRIINRIERIELENELHNTGVE